MADLIGILLSVNAQAYSFEAGNVRDEHEWKGLAGRAAPRRAS